MKYRLAVTSSLAALVAAVPNPPTVASASSVEGAGAVAMTATTTAQQTQAPTPDLTISNFTLIKTARHRRSDWQSSITFDVTDHHTSYWGNMHAHCEYYVKNPYNENIMDVTRQQCRSTDPIPADKSITGSVRTPVYTWSFKNDTAGVVTFAISETYRDRQAEDAMAHGTGTYAVHVVMDEPVIDKSETKTWTAPDLSLVLPA